MSSPVPVWSSLVPSHLAGHSLLDAIMDMAEVWRWEHVGVAVGKLGQWIILVLVIGGREYISP